MKKLLSVLLSLAAGLVALFCPSAWAGYAQLSSPAAWTQTAGTSFYRAAANDVSFANGIRGSAAVINVAGQAVQMPAAYRFAPNAARFAATFAFGNPLLLVGVAGAALAYQWYTDNNLEVVNGIWKKKVGGCTACARYRAQRADGVMSAWHPTKEAAADEVFQHAKGYFSGPNLPGSMFIQWNNNLNFSINYYPYGSVSTLFSRWVEEEPLPSQLPTYVPVTIEEFQDQMAPKAIPHGVPQVFPSALPVEMPIINPTPRAVPYSPSDPAPTARPMRVPQGQPQPIPNTNPQQYRKPVVDIVPAPVPSSPWRVDLQPKDIVTENPNPLPDAEPAPLTEPTPAPATNIITCGLPDTPACKIDEKGTPTTEDGVGTRTKELKDTYKPIEDFVKDPSTLGKPFPTLTWSFALPSNCSIIPLGTSFEPFISSIDVCQFQPMFHQLMSVVWSIGALFGAIGLLMKNSQAT